MKNQSQSPSRLLIRIWCTLLIVFPSGWLIHTHFLAEKITNRLDGIAAGLALGLCLGFLGWLASRWTAGWILKTRPVDWLSALAIGLLFGWMSAFPLLEAACVLLLAAQLYLGTLCTWQSLNADTGRQVFPSFLFVIIYSYPVLGLCRWFLADSPLAAVQTVIILVGMLMLVSRVFRVAEGEKPARWQQIVSWSVSGSILVGTLAMIQVSEQFPGIFAEEYFGLTGSTIFTSGLCAWAAIGLYPILHKWAENQPRLAALGPKISDYLPGMWIAVQFFIFYLILAITFNIPNYKLVDTYFDADNSIWMGIWSGDGQTAKLRAIHPLAYLLVRPVVWLLQPLAGSGFHAVLLVNVLAGAAGVFVFHRILRKLGAGESFALLSTAIFGFATTQIFFSANIESYIFSSLFLLLFVLAVLDANRFWRPTLAVLGVFGITVSNIIQPIIIMLVRRLPIKKILRMLFWVGSITVVGILVSQLFYKNAGMLFVPSSMTKEQNYVFSALDMPTWKGLGKTMLLARTILLYTVLGPQPFMLEDPNRDPMLLFFKFTLKSFSYGEYDGLGTVAVYLWAGLLLLAGLGFIYRIIKERSLKSSEVQLSIGFILCIGFNFCFHLIYGYEPFLYSADWMYAVILLINIGWLALPKRNWLEPVLLSFLIFQLINNIHCFQLILGMIDSFIG